MTMMRKNDMRRKRKVTIRSSNGMKNKVMMSSSRVRQNSKGMKVMKRVAKRD